MKRIIAFAFLFCSTAAFAQMETAFTPPEFAAEKVIKATPVKNQAMTGTCWCFSTTSLVESQCMKADTAQLDLSEMFTVRNIYIEKAKNYILRQSHAQFSEGGLGHDMIRAIDTYGALPEDLYSGLINGNKSHNHQVMVLDLQKYLDSILKLSPVPANWLNGYVAILNANIGTPPSEFEFKGKKYTPKSFAKDVVKFNAADYVNITSFTHQPYYKPFIIQVPDNFSNGSYYNIPLNEMIALVKSAVKNNYTVLWDADVSNGGFRQGRGMALNLDGLVKYSGKEFTADMPELPYNENVRQQLYENLTTQDDHLMHITGLEKSIKGKTFFLVKNSWGDVGPFKGYINVSEAYFAINTISLIVPKAAISKELLAKLGIK